MQVYHNSQDIEYRRPFGAAKTGSPVYLKIDAPDALNVVLRLWQDEKGENLMPMERQGDSFHITFTMPEEAGLLWYFFVITGPDGNVFCYGNASDELGGAGEIRQFDPPSYQITVYDDFNVPAWYKNALFYQIFPDSFNRGSDYKSRQEAGAFGPEHKGPERAFREEWDEKPSYERAENRDIVKWDFYGGTLEGVREKLDYLSSLGITGIYFNPVFEAASCHRYDTADYMNIDRLFGDNEGFEHFASEAKGRGIRIILDGVFSHTGADSIYFDKYGNYGGGAYSDEGSAYREWYRFGEEHPAGYECWWGVKDLPNVDELNPSYIEYICGENGVVRTWIRRGASGFRLDVADELPDRFIEEIRKAIKAENPDAVLIGEVWEDASNKISYSERRRYLLGKELDGTMNYPLRDILLDFAMGRAAGWHAGRRVMNLMEHYPEESFFGAFNLLGGHDRMRILSLLGGMPEGLSEADQAEFTLPMDAYYSGREALKMLAVLEYALPGVPCVYYGDEAGMTGGTDPFNRGPFPWGKEDPDLQYRYRMLGLLYADHSALKDGAFKMVDTGNDDVFGFIRENAEERLLVLANRNRHEKRAVQVEAGGSFALELLRSDEINMEEGRLCVDVNPATACIYIILDKKPEGFERDRALGILCHLTSLPSEDGEGTLGQAGRDFVDFLSESGAKLWQILPVNPVGLGDSPYLSPAVFAGDVRVIDRKELPGPEGLEAFKEENAYWLSDYTLYTALGKHFGTYDWTEWPEDAAHRRNLSYYKDLLKSETDALELEQYYFFTQWDALKKYANARGIKIIGDLPIYAAPHGADTWAHREAFQLDSEGHLKMRAGVPPDYFCEEGQDWGNPVYDWESLKATGYEWWIQRLYFSMKRFDYVRLDHFRSFSAYYAIPQGKTALEGTWQKGGGPGFFKAVKEALGTVGIIAEDLGALDNDVFNLICLLGYPGMNVWQFSDKEMQAMSPEKAKTRVFYSGTHDNQTLVSWCKDTDYALMPDEIIKELLSGDCPWVILQLQDMLSLDDSARLNIPGTPSGNWSWKCTASALTHEVARQYCRLISEAGR